MEKKHEEMANKAKEKLQAEVEADVKELNDNAPFDKLNPQALGK